MRSRLDCPASAEHTPATGCVGKTGFLCVGGLAASTAAARARWGYLEGPPFDLQRAPFDQGQCDLAAGAAYDTLKRGARDAHVLGRVSLPHALKVGEAQGLQFLVEQCDATQSVQGNTRRLVYRRTGFPCQDASFTWARHIL